MKYQNKKISRYILAALLASSCSTFAMEEDDILQAQASTTKPSALVSAETQKYLKLVEELLGSVSDSMRNLLEPGAQDVERVTRAIEQCKLIKEVVKYCDPNWVAPPVPLHEVAEQLISIDAQEFFVDFAKSYNRLYEEKFSQIQKPLEDLRAKHDEILDHVSAQITTHVFTEENRQEFKRHGGFSIPVNGGRVIVANKTIDAKTLSDWMAGANSVSDSEGNRYSFNLGLGDNGEKLGLPWNFIFQASEGSVITGNLVQRPNNKHKIVANTLSWVPGYTSTIRPHISDRNLAVTRNFPIELRAEIPHIQSDYGIRRELEANLDHIVRLGSDMEYLLKSIEKLGKNAKNTFFDMKLAEIEKSLESKLSKVRVSNNARTTVKYLVEQDGAQALKGTPAYLKYLLENVKAKRHWLALDGTMDSEEALALFSSVEDSKRALEAVNKN
jgi:hypothetical protein